MSNFLQTLKQFVSPGGIEGYFAIKYAEFAKNTEDMRDEYRRLASTAAGKIQDGKVLEVGPGPGYISIELARLLPNVEIIGLDISETMIEIARENAREYGLAERIEFRQGDASDMPFADSFFDFIISSGSLHHWEEPPRIFGEIRRVLKPGCQALISDLRRDAPEAELGEFTSRIDSRFMRWGFMHSVREGYTIQEVERLLNGIPFADLNIEEESIAMRIWVRK